MDFIQELTWRGMVHNMMPGTEEQLKKEMTTAYLGIDPTADSLHIGHLCGVMMLRHFQRCGHKPLALVGGATGMIGDPSGKSAERNLLDEATLRHNQEAIKKQLAKFLDFDSDVPNRAELVNNYDWTKDVTFLDFAREIGKHITVNYMMAKDSVKKRLNGEARDGLSFTEFTYQLLQGFDYYTLYKDRGCRLQLGGSDQWGNITTGTELIRRKLGGEAYALTCPLITKADGGKFGKTESGNVWLDPERTSPYKFMKNKIFHARLITKADGGKFGKTESGNVWLDPERTSPYKFYQFWLNVSDSDAEKYLKIFTFLTKEEIEALVAEHEADPGKRPMQKRLAKELTVMVHSEKDYEAAVEASAILFSNNSGAALHSLDERTLLDIFEGVPRFSVSKAEIEAGVPVLDLLAVKTSVFGSKGEARKMVQGGGVSVNKEKVTDPAAMIDAGALLGGKYIHIQKGKKNHFLLIAE